MVMKKRFGAMRVGLVVFATVLAMTVFAGCNLDDGDDDVIPQKITYTSKDAAGNTYALTITENTGRAAYTAKTGDSYTLTITPPSGPATTSKGTVTTVSGGSITLKPSTANAATFSVTVSAGAIGTITGDITFDDGTKESPPTELTPAPTESVSVAFSNLTANNPVGVTTIVTLSFDQDVRLDADDITITANGTGITKGTLTRTESGLYDLSVSGISAAGTITVAVAKSPYTFTPASQTVSVSFKTPKTWTAATPPSTGNFSNIAYGKDVFVAATNAKEIIWSADGVTWNLANTDAISMSGGANYVYFLNDEFLLVTRDNPGSADEILEGGNWAKSTDGKTWTAVAGGGRRTAGDGAYGNGTYVIGSNSGYVITGTPAKTWTAVNAAEAVTGINWVNGVAFGNGKFVITGMSGRIGSSSDGTSWTDVTPENNLGGPLFGSTAGHSGSQAAVNRVVEVTQT